jgi:hypothetical protein
MKSILLLVGCTVLLTGCGAVPSNSCVYGLQLSTSPAAAVASHMAVAPGNQEQFTADVSEVVKTSSSVGCALPAVIQLAHPLWSNPDPINISISSANDSTNGLAVCNAATSGPVTLTASTTSGGSALSSSVTLTCQ